jgi:hypothetical protein
MPDAEDIRLQSAYERALRTGDSASASSLLGQIQSRNQLRNAPVEPTMQDVLLRMQATGSPEERQAATAALQARMRSQEIRSNQPIAQPSSPVQFLANSVPAPTVANPSPLSPGDVFDDLDLEEQLEEIHNLRSEGLTEREIAYTLRSEPREQAPRSRAQDFLSETIAVYGADAPQTARVQEFITRKPRLAENIFNVSAGLGEYANRLGDYTNKFSNINDALYEKATKLKTKYQAGDFIPDFIAAPLGLKNPLVEPGGLIEGGTRLDPEGIRFLQEQKNLGSVLDRRQLDAMGGHVTIGYNPNVYISSSRTGPRLDLAFQSATGYNDPSSLKKAKADAAAQINRLQAELESPDITPSKQTYIKESLNLQKQRFENFSNELLRSQQAIEAYPLTSEAIRYQLGSAIAAAPEGTTLTANPIGGPEGSRARLYKGMSKGALETIPRMREPDPRRLPTDEEFRLARAGGGFTPQEYEDLRYGQQTIATLKKGPEQFETWRGQTINWNPEELKDPLIRASFNLGKDVDVSSLRQDPTSVFLNTRPFNPALPVITTQSPQYQARQAVKQTGKIAGAGTKAFLLDAGINYALGASPQEAFFIAATDPISAESLGGAPTAAVERRGPKGEFVDTRTNTVLTPQGRYTNTGIAIKGGKPIIVPRGSVAGEGNILTQGAAVLRNAANVWRQRLGALGIFGR